MVKLDFDLREAFLNGFNHYFSLGSEQDNPYAEDQGWEMAAWYDGYDAAHTLEEKYGTD